MTLLSKVVKLVHFQQAFKKEGVKSGETKTRISEDSIVRHDQDTEPLITSHERECHQTVFANGWCLEDLQPSDWPLTIELILLCDEGEFLSFLGCLWVFAVG